jgi:pre-mRNA-splicing factor RBM22/SLT11
LVKDPDSIIVTSKINVNKINFFPRISAKIDRKYFLRIDCKYFQGKTKNMQERGLGIRTGALKQAWEEADFPILCETCLGDNPYVRMLKQPLGKECKICTRPFTIFKWKAGTKGRFKKTEVCQTCAKLKNVCQTCLFDLQYGLPVEIRDKFLGENKITVPTEESNKNYWAQMASENIENLALPYDQNATSHPILEKIARTTPYYERNRAHVCTFWTRGECTRGTLCAYRHEAPEENQMNQNIKDRFHGVNDPVAKKILNQIENSKYLKAPEDKSIKTICISYVDESLVNDIE